MTHEHSKSPWIADHAYREISSDDGSFVAIVINSTNLKGNINLISAAPDLLAALKWMVANDETNEGDQPIESLGGMSWSQYNAYYIDGLNRARAAIAKAEGRS